MIQDALTSLGFTDKEIQVYLAVLENGKIAPANIASMTGIKRPTVYSVGKELIRRGVITEDLQGSSSYFVALPPQNLSDVLKKQEAEIAEKKKVVHELTKELADLPRSKSYSVPKMRFIDESNLVDFMYKQASVWLESLVKSGNPTTWGFQDHSLVENKEYLDWIDWYWKVAPKEVDLKLITNDSEIEEKMKGKKYDRRHIKFWKKDFAFTATQQIVGDYVLLFMTRQRPHYLVEIHDAVYAENLRQIFKNLWPMIG
ncbi:MAG TPA: helix-turn-helix domain-containing protein [Candidatus Paceibacterota bacterium]